MLNSRILVVIAMCALLPGTLTLTLGTPYGDDGAFLLRLEGPDMTQVGLAAPGLYLRLLEDQAGVTAVFVGDVTSGDLLTFHVPDVNRISSYGATALEAADRVNELRGSLAEYTLTVTPGS